MTRRRNLKIWRFRNVSHEQKSPLILIIFIWFLLHFARVIWDNCSVKPTILKTFCHFHQFNLQFNRECSKYKTLIMTFGRGPLLPQKTSAKTTKVTLKVHERNRERLNMPRNPENFFFMASWTLTQRTNKFQAD